jgi:hypothetical protein
VDDGRVRYVAASTHSHKMGAWLGSLRLDDDDDVDDDDGVPVLDAMMLRYNMAHKSAAERISFPVCAEAGIPVMAFTTTRWNKLQAGHPSCRRRPPTTPECLSFALSSSKKPSPKPWPVEVVLHSARTTDELNEALDCLSPHFAMTDSEAKEWRDYGDLGWNNYDGFDEYPEEQKQY